MNYSDKIVRSATIENMANKNGVVNVEQLSSLYKKISAGTIITGFVYVSEDGRAMHPLQAGITGEEHKKAWGEVVENVKKEKPDIKLIMQLAHTGRQTVRKNAVGASSKKCTYFKNKVKVLDETGIKLIVNDFAASALHAKRAGFDGVQIHAAHGYLIHQFLSPYTNTRKDRYKDRVLFLREVVEAVRQTGGKDFMLWLKISSADDRGLDLGTVTEILQKIDSLIDAVEISYGTMEYALNIIRGAFPWQKTIKINPLFNKYPSFIKLLIAKFIVPKYQKVFKPFSYNYNWDAALEIKKTIKTPIMLTGGIRSVKDIDDILRSGIDKVCLSRPFICEPDLVDKLNTNWISKCTNCNLCTIYVDSEHQVQCLASLSPDCREHLNHAKSRFIETSS